MKQSINDASARQRSGGPSPVPARRGNWNDRPRRADTAEVECQITGLVDRSTQELRLAWRQVHRTGPPRGLSRDLLIRALANQLQERSQGGASRALRRRLQSLAGEFEKSGASFDPGLVPKTGTTLVRQWRGHTHTILVRDDGFEYEGQRYRSLTVIAERITGAHWSGPRFFGLTKRAAASVGARTGR
jgi:Protein of unknown function (DUF2924)